MNENPTERKLDTPEEFSFVRRAKSFAHAGRGVMLFLRTTHNAWLHLVVFALAICLGFYFRISHIDWLALLLAAGLVLVSEAFNTAIEIDINLTSPEFHPYARDTKDVAAGAVLISAVIATVVGIIIFGTHILALI
jgi:diacylglycerol kinase (ATP)